MNQETQSIESRAMLVSLKISQWTARKLDRKTTERVAAEAGIDKKRGSYYKTLIGSDTLDSIKKKANEIRGYHYSMTLPWSDEGARLLPASAYFEYMQEVQRMRSEFDSLVDDFIREYPAAREEARRLLGGLFDEQDYPPADQVAEKFCIGLSVNPLPVGDDFRVDLSAEEVSRLREQIEQQTQAQLQHSMEAVHTRVATVIDAYIDRLEDNDTIFRNSLVENAQELARLLPSFNLTNDPKLKEIAQRIDRDLCKYTPDQLRSSETAREDTFRSARQLKSELVNVFGGNYA